MDRPKTPAGHPERLLECEEGLEEAILALAQNPRWTALANEETAGAID